MPITSRDTAQALSYRNGAERIEDSETLPVGPAQACPACGMKRLFASTNGSDVADSKTTIVALVGYHSDSPLNYPTACTDSKRIKIGMFRKCKVPREHLHEHCKACGHQWLTAFAGAT